jgi:hypothetical protein
MSTNALFLRARRGVVAYGSLAALLSATFLCPTAGKSQPLNGLYVGAGVGHMQSGSTVKFPPGPPNSASGQINDVSGNTILPRVVTGYSWAEPDGLFVSADIMIAIPAEPYPTTIVQFAGRQYVVRNRFQSEIGLRLGWMIRQDAAVYASIALSMADLHYKIDEKSIRRWFAPPMFGAGMELALDSHWSVRGDFGYQRDRYELEDVRVTTAGFTAAVNLTCRW